MGESITTKKKVPKNMRRYSDSCLLDTTDNVNCDRIPPLHDIVTTNNEKNEKLVGLSKVDCDNNIVENGKEETEDIEDDWFVKLTNSNESWSSRIPTDDGNSSDYGKGVLNGLMTDSLLMSFTSHLSLFV